MKRYLPLILVAGALAGCGSSGDSVSATPVDFKVRDGDAVIEASQAESEGLCEELQSDWPDELADYSQVTIDTSSQTEDTICVAAQ